MDFSLYVYNTNLIFYLSSCCDSLSLSRLRQCTFPLSLSLPLSLPSTSSPSLPPLSLTLPLSLPSLCLFLFPVFAKSHGILGKSSFKLGRMAKPRVLALSSFLTLPKYLSFIHHSTIITYTRRYFDFKNRQLRRLRQDHAVRRQSRGRLHEEEWVWTTSRSTSSFATPLETALPTTQLRSTPARTVAASEVRPTPSMILSLPRFVIILNK